MIFEDLKKSNTGSSRLRKLDFSLCSRCYTPFRHPCETISLSKFNANTVQIRQPHCWGPIKGHKAAQLLLIREGRQTGLSRCPFFALSVISFVVPGGRKGGGGRGKRWKGEGEEGEGYRFEHYVGPFTRDISRWCPVATFTLLKICFPHSLCMRLSFVTWRYARRIFNDRRSTAICHRSVRGFIFFFSFPLPHPPPHGEFLIIRGSSQDLQIA